MRTRLKILAGVAALGSLGVTPTGSTVALAGGEPSPAAVTATLDRTELGAGGCALLTVGVQPPKPGATVRVEQATSSGWDVVAEPVLDEASWAEVPRCHGWSSIGDAFSLRASYAGDAADGPGVSAVVTLEVIKARWMRRLDRMTAGRRISVSVREAGSFLYRRRDTAARIPASNEKLALAMALLGELPTGTRLRTVAAGRWDGGSQVTGDLWVIGEGDPTVGRTTMDRLAARIEAAGVNRIRGRVRASKAPFARDWFAPGWKSSFPRRYVARPTALTYEGNQRRGRHLRVPERRAAGRLTRALERAGVRVDGRRGVGAHPEGLTEVAAVSSPSLIGLIRRMSLSSSNFQAEVLGKVLGQEHAGPPGSIRRGASAIEAWAAAEGVSLTANDGSGLSYANRMTAAGMARLTGAAEGQAWGPALRQALPRGGTGTLRLRLRRVPVRAKTGTLTKVSALSGWVWLEKRGVWAEFSILSHGLSKEKAVRIEDRIVRRLSRSAR